LRNLLFKSPRFAICHVGICCSREPAIAVPCAGERLRRHGGGHNHSLPDAVVENPRVGDEFGQMSGDTSASVDVKTAASQVYGRGGKPSLQEAAIERGVVGGDQHHPAQKIVDGAIVDL